MSGGQMAGGSVALRQCQARCACSAWEARRPRRARQGFPGQVDLGRALGGEQFSSRIRLERVVRQRPAPRRTFPIAWLIAAATPPVLRNDPRGRWRQQLPDRSTRPRWPGGRGRRSRDRLEGRADRFPARRPVRPVVTPAQKYANNRINHSRSSATGDRARPGPCRRPLQQPARMEGRYGANALRFDERRRALAIGSPRSARDGASPNRMQTLRSGKTDMVARRWRRRRPVRPSVDPCARRMKAAQRGDDRLRPACIPIAASIRMARAQASPPIGRPSARIVIAVGRSDSSMILAPSTPSGATRLAPARSIGTPLRPSPATAGTRPSPRGVMPTAWRRQWQRGSGRLALGAQPVARALADRSVNARFQPPSRSGSRPQRPGRSLALPHPSAPLSSKVDGAVKEWAERRRAGTTVAARREDRDEPARIDGI